MRWLRRLFCRPDYDELSCGGGENSGGQRGAGVGSLSSGRADSASDPEVRAAFARDSTAHTAAHFVRAVLEGVAYSLEDTFTLFAEWGFR